MSFPSPHVGAQLGILFSLRPITLCLTYKFLFQALSGVGESIQVRAHILENTALGAALNTQFLIQIGVFTAIPMILGFILEQGFFRVRHLDHHVIIIFIAHGSQ